MRLPRTPPIALAIVALALVVFGAGLNAGPAEARTRGFCNIPLYGDARSFDCGRNEQVECDTGAPCDPGHRHVTFPARTVSCGPLADETISGACIVCGGALEISCAGANRCESGLTHATTGQLDGNIRSCELPIQVDDIDRTIPAVTVGLCPFCVTYGPYRVQAELPSAATILDAVGFCSPGVPDDLSGASRESWPASELPSEALGTVIFIHGRGSSCGGKDSLLHSNQGMLFQRNHRTYCVEYDRAPEATGAARRRVRVYEPVEQTTGEGSTPCAQDDSCSWNLADPLLEVTAPSYSIPGFASAVAEAIERIPTEGEISLVAHSQGGFIARALVHEHYDDLRWSGEKISRVITLGHPYYGKVVDPGKAAPWLCAETDQLDCDVQEWLWGWQDWLGSTAGNIDDTDFPQIEWTAVAGEGVGGTGEESQSNACLAIFGGTDLADVEGDTSVPIQSSLGVDEHGYYAVSPLRFDHSRRTPCNHGAACMLHALLEDDPERLPSAPSPGPPRPGALDFDGVDDVVGGLPTSALRQLVMSRAVTMEAWIYPDQDGVDGIIASKEGEYQFGLSMGELAWSLAITSPNWEWVTTGFFPTPREWTHVAVVYDDAVGETIVFANGIEVERSIATGPIGDFRPGMDDFRIGGRQDEAAHFAGRIDDVRIWSSARSTSQIREGLEGIGKTRDPDLRGAWRFDEGEGDALVDASAYGHTLSLSALGANSGPHRRTEDRNRAGGTLYFDGIDDRVRVTDPIQLAELKMEDALSIEAWIHPRGPGGNLGGVIVNKEGEYALTRLPDGTIAFSLAGTSLGWATIATAAVAPERVWTHVALTYSNSSGRAEIYLDGVLADAFDNSGSIGDAHPGLDELQIGGRQRTDGGQWFHGVIDEVRVWNRRRTAEQIAANYERVLPSGPRTGLSGHWRFDEVSGSLATDQSGSARHASLGVSGAAATPVRSSGPALPGYPAALLAEETPTAAKSSSSSCGLGAEFVFVVPVLQWMRRRVRGRRTALP
ncbi:MAG: LamG-like jellyroll fold domain-containing protein [Myxococcota bacterium]